MSHPPFQLLLRVRYAECDGQQVVFNGRYADYADIAATEFMREVVGGYQTLLAQQLDNQVVSLHIDWQSSASFDDVLSLEVNCSHIGNTSFTLKVVITQAVSQQVVAVANIVYVMVETKSHCKTAIPPDVKDQLRQGASGVVCDQSGTVTTRD